MNFLKRMSGSARGKTSGQGHTPLDSGLPSSPNSHFSIDDAFDIPEDDVEAASILTRAEQARYGSGSAGNRANGGRRHLSSSGSGAGEVIPEEEDEEEETPIIRNGHLRMQLGSSSDPSLPPSSNSDNDAMNAKETASQDSASLIQSGGATGESGYYGGPPPEKFWWRHPKIRKNYKLVGAAFCLVFLGLALILGGIVAYCIPAMAGVQGLVFLIAGIICFVPGAYHIGYIYMAVKGKRGFEFNHLPLFNN